MSIRRYWQPDVHALIEGFDRTLTEADFEPYQRFMIRLMLTHPSLLLGAFMGSGKTACALHALRKLIDRKKVRRGLVIAPYHVAKDTWPDEILTWDFARAFSYAVAVGTPEERRAALDLDAEVTIINRENLKWLYETVGARRWPFDALIYDEASRLKGGNKKTSGGARAGGSMRRKSLSEFGYLNKIRYKHKYVWLLTGTPATNGVIDLWGPSYILDRGERLGRSRTKFLERWFRYDSYARTHEPFEHSEAEIMARLKGQMFVLREEDYIDLPPLAVKDRWVSLSPEHYRQYREFVRTHYLKELDVEAANSAVLVNKLLQFSNGSVWCPEEDDPDDWRKRSVAKPVHDCKLRELESIVAEAGGRPLLIAYSYRFDVQAIKRRFPRFRVYGETPNDLRDWNAGKLPALILHPAAAGHGLNFQHGSNIAVWYGLNWSLELYQQFNKRLHRRGQQADRVWLYRILARNTADARVAALLEERAVTQDRITDAVRVHAREAA